MIAFHGLGGHFIHDGFDGGPLGIVWGLLMMALWIAFWAVIIVVAVRMIRRGARETSSTSAVQVLEERYARGEISREEFTERRAVLLGREPPPPQPTSERP